jgi:hypothetical protein
VSDAGTWRRIREILDTHYTATLATCDDGRAWAATVFFASDADCNLYFVSDERTRHGRDLARDPHVVAAINRDVGTWDEVLGLQIEGRAEILRGDARDRALQIYLARFADVRRLFASPEGDSEKLIAARLRSTPFWRLAPGWIRLIDSREGFGWKREFAVTP